MLVALLAAVSLSLPSCKSGGEEANTYPVAEQFYSYQDGAACLKMIAEYHGKSLNLDSLTALTQASMEQGVTLNNLIEAADAIGFTAESVFSNYTQLQLMAKLPAIIHWDDKAFAVVYEVSADSVKMVDPAVGLQTYPKDFFMTSWTKGKEQPDQGVLVMLEKKETF